MKRVKNCEHVLSNRCKTGYDFVWPVNLVGISMLFYTPCFIHFTSTK